MQALVRQYQQELNICRQQFDAISLQKERGYLVKYTTFSANLQNLLPEIPRQQHESLFRELLLQQMFTLFDQSFLNAGDLVKLRGGADQIMRADRPRIYCTFHLGSYRLLTSVLFRKGIDCVLLVGSEMNRQQGDSMREHIDALRQERGLTNEFKVVEAGNPSAIMVLMRELRAGKSLIVYVDGSPETAPEKEEVDKMLSVCFGQRHLLTRKGVGYLSHLSGVPIIPVINYRQANLINVIECMEPIVPDRSVDRDTYCQVALQRLYDTFWPYLNRYPAQWEGWTYIHSFLLPEAPGGREETAREKTDLSRVDKRPIFNEERYSLCDLEEAPVLFDRRLYETYEISTDLRDLLLSLNEVDSLVEVVGAELFGELVEKEILR